MRVMSWKYAKSSGRPFLYEDFDSNDGDVYVYYPTDEGFMIYEKFPTTRVCSKELYDLNFDEQKFNKGESEYKVSELETYRDVDYNDDSKVIVFDSKDIDVWISKLESLKS